MKDGEIRERFKKFFEDRLHNWYTSISLVPQDDPTMLFTTAGMVQFKKQLLGEAGRVTRAVSIQKCLRTSDIDNVGMTSRHLTFFEMYGNFSFGDYFKEDAIKFGWDFLVEELKLPVEKLYATVYKDDDEAYNVWKKYLPEEKIYKLGDEDNFWKMGDTGPCGPCSEIIYDMGPGKGCGKEDCQVGCGCDRYLEVWNLVFTQFDRQSDGTLNELPKKNIDTGMGLERLDQIVGGKDSVFETPMLKPIIDEVEKDTEVFNPVSGRIIADHVRAITFLIGDGISPSNEGRGYVLRRLIRRAAREGRKLGWGEPMLWRYTSTVIDVMGNYYPAIIARANHIAAVCKMEEESFLNTLSTAMRILDGYIKELNENGLSELSAQKAFKLYDTYGLPVDITKNILRENSLGVDEGGFKQLLEERSKSTLWKEKEKVSSYWDEIKDVPKTESLAYESYIITARVVKVLNNGKAIILDRSPMYAQSGGQVGDTGYIKNPDGLFKVENTVKEDDVIIHEGTLEGAIKEGDEVEVNVNADLRKAIERNHTATHLLQSVLRNILGKHVEQNGSLVEPSKLRFDFTHTEPLTAEQLKDIEQGVNSRVMDNMPVMIKVMDKQEAIKEGALAFFGEKYKKEVRAVIVSDPVKNKTVSMELCGGTHLHNTGEIGLFKIISENGIAAGVRRIEAVTGNTAVEYTEQNEMIISSIAEILNSPENRILDKIRKLKQELKDKDKKINNLRNKIAIGSSGAVSYTKKLPGATFYIHEFDEINITIMRTWADSMVKKDSTAALAVGKTDSKVTLILKISKDLTDKYSAQQMMKEAAKEIDGSGGGRCDMAQGGGTNPSGVEKVINIIEEYFKEL